MASLFAADDLMAADGAASAGRGLDVTGADAAWANAGGASIMPVTVIAAASATLGNRFNMTPPQQEISAWKFFNHEDRVRDRLRQLAARLCDSDWLDGDFTCGDLLTIDVLRRLEGSGLIEEFPNLAAWITRGEARPAFRRALEAQRADWERQQGER
jgi:glutathione S-transferase